MGSTRPNPTHVGCIGLGWTSMMGWVGLNFFDLPWWVGSKNPLNPTQPNPCTPLFQIMPTYLHLKLNTTIRLFFKILDYEISFQDCKFFMCFCYLSNQLIQWGIYNFLLNFGILILCENGTCLFFILNFQIVNQTYLYLCYFVLVSNARICIILLLNIDARINLLT